MMDFKMTNDEFEKLKFWRRLMKENYNKCMALILKHEGGFVNHPEDPGGATNMGVTQRVYESWVGHNVSIDEMRNLTTNDVLPIYKANYWDKVHGDVLPKGLDLCVFDFAVNSGTGRAATYLQRLVGSHPDGAIGPNTLASVEAYVNEHGLEVTIHQYQQRRQAFLEGLPTFPTFGKGWTRRVDETRDEAIKMVHD